MVELDLLSHRHWQINRKGSSISRGTMMNCEKEKGLEGKGRVRRGYVKMTWAVTYKEPHDKHVGAEGWVS